MKIFIYIYLFLYISYIILGPHYIARLIRNDEIQVIDSFDDLSRMFFLTYIALLFSAYFFYKNNILSWLFAIIVNIFALIGFLIKFYERRNTDPYYYIGIISHILLILPIIIGYFYYNLNIKKIKSNKIMQPISLLGIAAIIYLVIQNNIYID
jgi:hypothetical protein